MTDPIENSENLADDMAEYLQTFLDETEEQLDDLVETMLALEQDSANVEDLNEAFRLIHSIKGSAGMMGFDSITVLTHHLEDRFERFRSGRARLDEPTMNLVLQCIDFLRQCNNRLRDGQQLSSSVELLDALRRSEGQGESSAVEESQPPSGEQDALEIDAAASPSTLPSDQHDASDTSTRMVVRFRAGLQLADLKAQLIVTRLAGLGEVQSTQPDLDQLLDADQLDEFAVQLETNHDWDTLRAAADVEGVESIDFPGATAGKIAPTAVQAATVVTAEPAATSADQAERNTLNVAQASPSSKPELEICEPTPELQQQAESPLPSVVEKTTTKVAETMRVDIDRLDNLMNLAGELVVNRARFVQASGQVSPELRKGSMLDRVREFSDSLRQAIESMENVEDARGDWSAQIQQLRTGLEMLEEQSGIWDNGRRCFGQIAEAIDQLSQVSHSLQRGVLETRMVPVGPLFNRFKRVVRDLSKERGKQVQLLIRGENTELDKRMIDELGDPLVHLVRNSMDHGLEPPALRVSRDKPEAGTICLEASHSGNNVYIHVRDDGGGIDVEKIKVKLLEKRILSESAVAELSDEQALDFIWHPGFSTAKAVTDVSGRGVGMDVVKTRISQLNGTIDVDSTPQQGTTFTIRLPLTLAIINCLLIRLQNVIFSMPIDEVREIVSVAKRDVVAVHGTHTFDVRGEFIPLVSIDDVFHWHHIDYGYDRTAGMSRTDATSPAIEVVILHTGGKTLGLRVDELLGCQDMVIKSLSDNFINIRGLSGASILGDGSVCLMLDIGTLIDMATSTSRAFGAEDVVT